MSVRSLTAARRTIGTAIVAEAFPAGPPIVARLIASAFAARLIEWRNDAGLSDLARWADRTCERYGHIVNVAKMLRSACAVARGVLRRQRLIEETLDRDLGTLERSIAASVDRIARSATHTNELTDDVVDSAIASFLLRLDGADPLSAEHSRAVALWCRRLARRIALSDGDCNFVARGGLLHDVGKTTTPSSILLAPRRLTDDEFAIMREHAPVGGEMIRSFDHLQPFIPLVRGHHERIDGAGYPDRLSGPEISLHVRIVSVADCFNAMIGRRPYRLPMSPAVALEQLVAHRGTQFDPLVVDAMVDIIERPEQ